jgi:hypothetical protein
VAQLWIVGDMSDWLKIVYAVGVGIYSVIGLHFYSLLVSRSKNDVQRFFLCLFCIILVIGGGLVGCCAIMGALYNTGRPPSTDNDMRFATLITWAGSIWIYLILSRNFRKRLKLKK